MTDDLQPGQIRFVHFARPGLLPGEYEVRVTQDLSAVASSPAAAAIDAEAPFEARRTFYVVPPRFGLQPRDVHSVYPPPTSPGTYDDVIPHVVLRRRTLPWEIPLPLTETAVGPDPWMALLVFHPGEAPTSTVGLRSGLLDTPPTGYVTPQLNDPRLEADPRLTVIDLAGGQLQKVLPHRADLPWTAHVREVLTGGKELLGLADDGWFSVVMSTRQPAAGENVAHLVSLEGWHDILPKGNAQNASSKSIEANRTYRMISLASWTFTSLANRGSFGELMTAIVDKHNDEDGVDDPQRALLKSDREIDTSTDAGVAVDDAVQHGFVPLRYDMRHGEQSVAWYRGPLTPEPVPRTVDRAPLPTAEAGLIYHENMAMFDTSYAVAWQLGRLLALSDPEFSNALMEWRQTGQRRVDRILAQEEAIERHAEIQTFKRAGELAAKVTEWVQEADRRDAWAGIEVAEGDEAAAVLEERRRSLMDELRAFVLESWDPNSLATAIGTYASDVVLRDLTDPTDGALVAAPDPKRLLGGEANV